MSDILGPSPEPTKDELKYALAALTETTRARIAELESRTTMVPTGCIPVFQTVFLHPEVTPLEAILFGKLMLHGSITTKALGIELGGMHEREVRKHIAKLESLGLVERVECIEGKLRRANRFICHVPELDGQ